MAKSMPPNGDSPKEHIQFRDWRGMNTRAARNAIPQDQWALLENWQPVGPGNLRSTPGGTSVVFGTTIPRAQAAYVRNNSYALIINGTTRLDAVNVDTAVQTGNINSNAYPLNAASFRVASWQNTYAIIADPSGVYAWDGTLDSNNVNPIAGQNFLRNRTGTFQVGETINQTAPALSGTITAVRGNTIQATMTGGAQLTQGATVTGATSGAVATVDYPGAGSLPSSATDVAVYAGRLWIASGRTLTFSAPNNFADFSTANGAGSVTISDETLRGNITRLFAANGYLYIFGISSIDVISDVRVPSGVTPPTPLFTRVNIDPIVGTALPDSVVAYSRSVCFANKYGFFALDGVTVTKLSQDLDDTVSQIVTTTPVTGAVGICNNILCVGFAFLWQDPSDGIRNVQAWYFDGKWFFTSNTVFASNGIRVTTSSVTQILSSYANGSPVALQIGNGTVSTTGQVVPFIISLFSDPTQPQTRTWRTALWDAGRMFQDKQALKFGIESYQMGGATPVMLYLENESSSGTSTSLTLGGVTWMNATRQTVTWTNTLNLPVAWTYTGLVRAYTDVTQTGKYLGAKATQVVDVATVSALMLQLEHRANW